MYLAEPSVLMVAAMLLAVYDIADPRTAAGVPITPDTVECTGGTIRCALVCLASGVCRQMLTGGRIDSHPAPFRCSFTPRSEKARALILALQDTKA